MRALTLTQPWAGLVASGIKLIENRPRKMIAALDFGKQFAIHASRMFEEKTVNRIIEIAPELAPRGPYSLADARWYKLAHVRSAIIGVATLRHQFTGWDQDSIFEHGASLTETIRIHTGRTDQLRWFFGPVGYVLSDVVALPRPIPCRGHQGFWTVDAIHAADIGAQLEVAA